MGDGQIRCGCGKELLEEECEQCAGEGMNGHDCGEDTCVCRYPEANVKCQSCNGTGTTLYCPVCDVPVLARQEGRGR